MPIVMFPTAASRSGDMGISGMEGVGEGEGESKSKSGTKGWNSMVVEAKVEIVLEVMWCCEGDDVGCRGDRVTAEP